MIDDQSEPGAWADCLLFPPFIADERDGAIFRNLPNVRLQRRLKAGEGQPNAGPALCVSLHADPIATDERDNPHER